MIGFIRGEAVEFSDNSVLLECNGIGYEIAVSYPTLLKLQKGSPFVTLQTYMNVREDGIFLYGFYGKEEKNMFLKLITVGGVGPKAALGILSGIELNDLMAAILSQDIKTLSKIKGVGKKTAERIIVELKEKIDADSVEFLQTALTFGDEGVEIDKDSADAISALRGLGFTQAEAIEAVKKAKPFAQSAEELVARALRSL